MKTQTNEFQNLAAALQDNRVSDADLMEALVRVFHQGWCTLAQSLLLDPQQSRRALVSALASVVARRRDYWGEQPLPVWINRLVLKEMRKVRKRVQWTAMRSTHESRKESAGLFQPLGHLDEQQRVVLALRYGQSLELVDISTILDLPLTRVEIYLKKTRAAWNSAYGAEFQHDSTQGEPLLAHTMMLEAIEKAADGVLEESQRAELDLHLGACPACRERADALRELENHLHKAFSAPSEQNQTAEENITLIAEGQKALNRLRQTRAVANLTRQLLLTAGMIFILAFLAWRFLLPSMLPPQPTQAPATAMPTGTPDPWVGYHQFTYVVYAEDTPESLAELTGLSVEEILSLNNFSPSITLTRGSTITLALPEAAFIPSSERKAINLPDLLTAESGNLEILERIAQSVNLINSLWGEVYIVHYGPPGYSGLPFFTQRNQYWWTHDGFGTQLSEYEAGSVLANFYTLPTGIYFYRDPEGRLFAERDPSLYAGLPEQWGLTSRWDEAGEGKIMKVAGTDQVLGRPVVVVDRDMGDLPNVILRMWVDAENGLFLRSRVYIMQDEGWTTVSEIGFTALELDSELPLEIFSPFSFVPDRFAIDASGEFMPDDQPPRPFPWSVPLDRRPKERLTPPDDFNPAQEKLTLQWPGQVMVEWDGSVDVFAGQYYLGSFSLKNGPLLFDPSSTFSAPFDSCTRSPDGSWVALSTSQPFETDARLYYFPLTDPESAQVISIHLQARYEFVIDPSSRYLAYYGCQNGCGVRLLDLYTQESTILFDKIRGAPVSLTWSPDGEYLAMLALLPGSSLRQIIVVDSQQGEIVYQVEYGWGNKPVPEDSPTLDWGRPFPVEGSYMFNNGCLLPHSYASTFDNDGGE